MTEQLKAEAYVREQRPALMELSFGCEVKDTHNQQYYKICNKSVNGDLFVSFGTLASSQYRIAEERIIIIGHPINLQDWLAVLRIGSIKGELQWSLTRQFITVRKDGWQIVFDQLTGQPATEGDFSAFCDIMGI